MVCSQIRLFNITSAANQKNFFADLEINKNVEWQNKKWMNANRSNRLTHKYVCQLRQMSWKSKWKSNKQPTNNHKLTKLLTLLMKHSALTRKLDAFYAAWLLRVYSFGLVNDKSQFIIEPWFNQSNPFLYFVHKILHGSPDNFVWASKYTISTIHTHLHIKSASILSNHFSMWIEF